MLIFLASCQKEELPAKKYEVPDIIQPYIDDFIAEGAKRGENIIIDNLVVEFTTSIQDREAAGLCTFATENGPPKIQFDSTSANWQNSIYSREALVFHELGHCILDRRQHKDDIMSNGNFASIMRTKGEQMFGGQINNFKRDYYLDELFDANTSEPEWAKNIPPYNTVISTQKTRIFWEEFNSDLEANRLWTRSTSSRTILRVENGQYYFESRDDGAYFSVIGFPFNSNKDFEIETAIRVVKGDGLTMFQWGGNALNNSFFYGFTAEQFALLGSWDTGLAFAKTLNDLNTNNYSKLTIRKIDDNYYFYIDEELFENGKFENFSGNLIGFYVGAQTAIQIDYLRISGI